VTTEVNNTGGNDSVFCELRCEIAGEMTSVSIKVAPKAKLTVAFPDITLQQPELWWPNGYGPEHLYPLKVTGTVNEQISDEEKLNVGVRQLEAVWTKVAGCM
jgi:beta-galactosidase/beta-glucuronidase